jgi:Collagen triple helix repeat (20 copies)
MFIHRHRRLSYANVTATLALAFSLTGGALAASHYVISSTKQISPRVLKQLRGETGAAGALGAQGSAGPAGKDGGEAREGPPSWQGPPGREGQQGKDGPAGREGPPGTAGPIPSTLPSGKTLKGSFGGAGAAVTETNNAVELTISYPFPLAASPAAEVVQEGGPPTENCPGTAAAPSAIAGHLCVYVGSGHQVDTKTVSTYGDDGSRDYRYGAVVYATRPARRLAAASYGEPGPLRRPDAWLSAPQRVLPSHI